MGWTGKSDDESCDMDLMFLHTVASAVALLSVFLCTFAAGNYPPWKRIRVGAYFVIRKQILRGATSSFVTSYGHDLTTIYGTVSRILTIRVGEEDNLV